MQITIIDSARFTRAARVELVRRHLGEGIAIPYWFGTDARGDLEFSKWLLNCIRRQREALAAPSIPSTGPIPF